MLLAAEYTTATLAAWFAVALVVGLVLGWLLRPWLVSDRLRDDYEGELRRQRADREQLESEREAQEAAAAQMKSELELARGDAARLNAELAGARSRVADLEAQVASLALEKDAEISRLAAEAGKVGALEVAIGERDARIAALEAELVTATSAAELAREQASHEQALAAVRRELEESESRLRTFRQRGAAEAAAAARELEQTSTELALAKERADAAARELEELRSDHAALAARNAELEAAQLSAPSRGERAADEPVRSQPDGVARRDTAPSPVAPAVAPESAPVSAPASPDDLAPAALVDDGPHRDDVPQRDDVPKGDDVPHRDDDLKRIRGIGPAIERKLKGMGITTFQQIARLTEADISRVGDALGSFRDRIQRDDWIGSAAQLLAETHPDGAD